MYVIPPDVIEAGRWLAPPVIGGFIGYLTNRIAIRMLFRPLTAWRILGFRVPLTPGVIPSKRHDLACNMGDVVGNHLLTDKELGKAIHDPRFQEKLHSIIQERLDNFLSRDLGTLNEVLPEKFRSYVSFGLVGIAGKVKQEIGRYFASEQFARSCSDAVSTQIERLMLQETRQLCSSEKFDKLEKNLAEGIEPMLSGPEIDDYLIQIIRKEIFQLLQSDKKLGEIIPEKFKEKILSLAELQAPILLQKLSEIVDNEETADKIIDGVSQAVEGFIDSLGPMADMVRNFLPGDKIREQVRNQFESRKEHITRWLSGEYISGQLIKGIHQQIEALFERSIVSLLSEKNESDIESLCQFLGKSAGRFLRERGGAAAIAAHFAGSIRERIDKPGSSVEDTLAEIGGTGTAEDINHWLQNEVVSLAQSEQGERVINSAVDHFMTRLPIAKIGRLDRWLPPVVKQEIGGTFQNGFSKILAQEIPSLVERLNIRKIIIERLDSLDLLHLEGLLLSIMEEQFKYINIFGALLGFIIGCVNLLVLL